MTTKHDTATFLWFRGALLALFFFFQSLGNAEPKSVSVEVLYTSSAKEIAYQLYSSQNANPASFKDWDKANFRNKYVVARALVVDGEFAGYVSYELRPKGFHLINFSLSDKITDPQIRASLINKMISNLGKTQRMVVTADSTKLLPEYLEILKSVGFQTLPPSVRANAPRSAFNPQGDIALHRNHEFFNAEAMPSSTHFEKLGVTLDDNAKTIAGHYKILKTFYPNSSPWAKELDAAFVTLTNETQRTAYINSHAQQINQPKRKLVEDSPIPDFENLDLYQRIGRHYAGRSNASQERIQRDIEVALLKANGNQKHIQAILEARSILKDPELRAIYDAILGSTEDEDRKLAVQRFLHSQFPDRYLKPPSPKVRSRSKIDPSPSYSEANPLSNSLHQRLGVAENAKPDEIWEAFRVAAQRYPDLESTENRNLREAYAILGNEENSDAYAQALAEKGKLNKTELKAWIRRLRAANKKNPTVPVPETDGANNRVPVDAAVPNASNFYSRLGVPENASADKIFDAALSLLSKTRKGSKERKSLLLTYEILHSEDFRRIYDDIQQHSTGKARKEAIDDLSEEVEAVILSRQVKSAPSRQGETFYSLLGVGPNASGATVENRFLERWNTANDEDKPALEAAFSILREKSLRELYDKLLKDGASNDEIAQLLSQGKERDSLRILGGLTRENLDSVSLAQFIAKASPHVFSLHHDPQQAERYLQTLRTLLERKSPADWETLRALAGELEKLKGIYGQQRSEPLEDFRSQLLQLRSEVAEQVISAARNAKQDPNEIYPKVQPGDLVHKLLTDASKADKSAQRTTAGHLIASCQKLLSTLKSRFFINSKKTEN